MAESATAARKVQAAERQARAVELRKLGLTYQRIGERLGVSRQAAFQAVQKALRELNTETQEKTAELRRLELERLDELEVRLKSEMQKGPFLPALDRMLKLMERRAKLLGLDAATKGEQTVAARIQFDQKPDNAEDAQQYLDTVLGSRHGTG